MYERADRDTFARSTSSGATPTSAAHLPTELAAVTLKVDWRVEPTPWKITLRIPWGVGRPLYYLSLSNDGKLLA